MRNSEQKRRTDDIFLEIGKFINLNYEKLMSELAETNQLLSAAETYSMAYIDKQMAKVHFISAESRLENKNLQTLFNMFEKVNKGMGNEFFQNIDFINIYEDLCDKILKDDGILTILQIKRALEYIIYEMKRMEINATYPQKQITILKGMICYY